MALYFSKEEADDLKKAPLIMETAHFLGVPMKKVGGLWSMLCPLHNDNHYGSCMIKKNNTGAVCYVCHKKIRPLGLLMQHGYNYYDSLCVLARLNGSDFQYEQAGKSDEIKKEQEEREFAPKIKYNWNEACFLGFAPHVRNIELQHTFEEISEGEFYKDVQEDGSVLYVKNTTGGNPLRDLEKEDPEAFKFLMAQKAKEKMFDCIVTYDCIKKAKGPRPLKVTRPLYEGGEDVILHAIISEYNKAVKILKKFGEKPPKKRELITEICLINALSRM